MPVNTKLATVYEVIKHEQSKLLVVTSEGEYVVDSDNNRNLYYLALGVGKEETPMRVALHIDTSHNHIIEIDVIGSI